MFRAVLIAILIPIVGGAQLTPEEGRGRQIYEHGTSPSGGSIEAVIAGGEEVAGAHRPLRELSWPRWLRQARSGHNAF